MKKVNNKVVSLEITVLENQIHEQKEFIYRMENADDFYYTLGSYKTDKAILEDLQKSLKTLKEQFKVA